MPVRKTVVEPLGKQMEFLSNVSAQQDDRRSALWVVVLSLLGFIAAIPFARVPLPQVPAFIPVYQSGLIINDAITAVLLFAQFTFVRSRALWVLASAYLFTAVIAALHLLTFPGLFSATGWLAARPQSTAWLYMFWHGSFPLAVIAYALLKLSDAERKRPSQFSARTAMVSGAVIAAGCACAFAALATAGHTLLPEIMQGNRYSPAMIVVVSTVWMLSFLALAALWMRGPHTVLDLWLMVVMCAWIFDVGLSAVFNAGRFDLGFYAGRIYGLLAASYVLIVLLLETTQLYARFLQVKAQHAEDLQKVNDSLERAYRGVTEELQRNVEELKAQQTELEASNEELERFAYICSHDMQEPVRMMNSYAGLLADRYDAKLDARGHQYLGFITSNAGRMQKMIQDILNFSRVGREEVKLERVDCNSIACQVIAEFESEIGEKNARITCSELPVLDTSLTLMRVLFQNLISNALKFQDGGKAPEIEIRAERLEDSWRFCVRDNGIGIDPVFSDKVFAIFQRIHRKEDYPGTGIGLSTCRKFVKLHGGDIGFTSTPGEGSAFFFIVPQ
jgi:signal transduction histidine kinase